MPPDAELIVHLTVGEIARRLHVSLHRVEYLIRARRIRPIGVAGNARIFAEQDLRHIADELRRINAGELEGGGAG